MINLHTFSQTESCCLESCFQLPCCCSTHIFMCLAAVVGQVEATLKARQQLTATISWSRKTSMEADNLLPVFEKVMAETKSLPRFMVLTSAVQLAISR